jgi:hypothetical protein
MSGLYMRNSEYLAAMERLKKIVSEKKLDFFDDTTPGDKDTSCTWGLCQDSIELWPTKELHLWPREFPQRLAPKYLKKHHVCPNDYDPTNENGCFYHCKFFQRKADGWGRQEVLTKIDELITGFKKKYKT